LLTPFADLRTCLGSCLITKTRKHEIPKKKLLAIPSFRAFVLS
jgi:hypothetical protein